MTRITQIISDRPRGPILERRRLIVALHGESPRSFVEDRITIGASSANSLTIDRSSVSRHHARIEVEGDDIMLRDLGSTNGTFLEGVRIERAHLPDRARLRLGDVEIHFSVSDEVEELPLHEEERIGRMVGRSVAMRRLFADIGRIAASPLAVLITGESGVGKELVAQCVHELSDRRDKPLQIVDCRSLSPNLVETELFGHVAGAFTGAVSDHPGAFEIADGGTIFFDEIGELDLALQPKLLRVLEDKRVRRVGASEHTTVDVRLVASSNKDLEAMVSRGELREDLFYRLNTVQLHVPPLRQRLEDIELLVADCVAELRQTHQDLTPVELTPRMLSALKSRSWSGNVRELRNFVERAILLNLPVSEALDVDPRPQLDFAGIVDFEASYAEQRDLVTSQFEHAYLTRAMQRCKANVSRVSRECKMHRGNLIRLLRKHGIR